MYFRLSIDLDASFISNVVEIPSESSPLQLRRKHFLERLLKSHKLTQANVYWHYLLMPTQLQRTQIPIAKQILSTLL